MSVLHNVECHRGEDSYINGCLGSDDSSAESETTHEEGLRGVGGRNGRLSAATSLPDLLPVRQPIKMDQTSKFRLDTQR